MKWRDKQRLQQEEQRKQAAVKGGMKKRAVKQPKGKTPDNPDRQLRLVVDKSYQNVLVSTTAGSILINNDIHKAVQALRSSSSNSAAQQLMNYQAQVQQQIIAQQLRGQGGGQMALSRIPPRGSVTKIPFNGVAQNMFYQQYAPAGSPSGPPKFNDGDRVLIGQGKTIHRIKHSEWDGYQYWYSCVSEKGTTKKAAEDTVSAVPAAMLKKKVDFDTVILDEVKKQSIIDTLEGVANHELIFTEWGFDEVMEKGKATSFLFWGPPGTGKTLMAQAMADKIGKELLIIGSAEIESSEPGGAERAIKSYFQTKDKVLLFDECDSLVYERAGVGAILGAQVNALLTSLENYEGTVIFTTNRLGVLDEAFNRRLSLKVEFAMPDHDTRVKIWQRMFPKKAPLDENIDWDRLASVEVAGGYIKNAVLRAARMTANRKAKAITEDIIVDALRDELKSMIDFEEAKANTYHVPRMSGGYSMSRGQDITKSIGGI